MAVRVCKLSLCTPYTKESGMRGFRRVQEEADASNLIGDVRLAALAAALLATVGMAGAQQAPSTPPARTGVSERAQRDAESPFRWIRIQSETVRKAAVAPTAASAVTAASPAPARTAAAKPAPAKPVRLAAVAPAQAVAGASAVLQPAAEVPVASPPAAKPIEEPLVNIDRADPEWDEDLMHALRRGHVVVRFNVAEDGYLSRIQIVESSNSRLTGPVMGALMQWRFEPIAEPRVATVEFGFDLDSGRR